MHSPCNSLIVKLKQKYYDTLSFESGVKLHVDPSWHPEEWAMLEAEIHTVPDYIIKRFDYEHIRFSLKPGDIVLIRYDVVFAYNHQPDRDSPIHKNVLFHFNEQTQEYEEYWRCDMQKVFAKVDGDEYVMQNEYIMVEPYSPFDLGGLGGRLWTPAFVEAKQYEDRATVLSINEPDLPITKGDKVIFRPRVAQKYRIDQKVFWIISRRHLHGKISA